MDEGYTRKERHNIHKKWIDSYIIMLVTAFIIGTAAYAYIVNLCCNLF